LKGSCSTRTPLHFTVFSSCAIWPDLPSELAWHARVIEFHPGAEVRADAGVDAFALALTAFSPRSAPAEAVFADSARLAGRISPQGKAGQTLHAPACGHLASSPSEFVSLSCRDQGDRRPKIASSGAARTANRQ
jgi:hypothetical protein